MNNTPTGYCRLCGELKSCHDFINLLEDRGAYEEITRKLQRVNAVVDFTFEILPMTVCFICITDLHRAFDFVFNVERAQSRLYSILLQKPIKDEVEEPIINRIDSDTGDQNIVTPPPQSPPSVKVENDTVTNVKPFQSLLFKKTPKTFVAGTSNNKESFSSWAQNVPTTTENISASPPPKNIPVFISVSRKHILASKNSTLLLKNPPESSLAGTSHSTENISKRTEHVSALTKTISKINFSASPIIYIPALPDNISASAQRKNISATINSTIASAENNSVSASTKSTSASTEKDTECSFPPRPEVTWSTYKWMCSYCGTEFATIKELNSHSMQFHESCNAYRCTDCKMRKTSLKLFLKHVKAHREHLRYSCHLCFKPFLSFGEVRRHNFEEHLKMETENFCEGCHSLFENKAALEIHKKSYFKLVKQCHFMPLLDQTQGLTCLMCNRTFKSKPNLQNHLITHTDRRRDYTCEACGKCFFKKQALDEHVIVVHNDARPFQCEICKAAAFKTHQKLRNHIINTHSTSKPFECKDCGSCFKHKRLLAAHSIIHSDLSPHVCEHCNKAFKTKSKLTMHLRQHTGVKPYSCVECSKHFTNWGNYNKHMKGIHGVDKAKRKHTSEGSFPIDPKTGEPMIPPKTEQMMEWKRQVMQSKQRKKQACFTDTTLNAVDPKNNVSINTVTLSTQNEDQNNCVKISEIQTREK